MGRQSVRNRVGEDDEARAIAEQRSVPVEPPRIAQARTCVDPIEGGDQRPGAVFRHVRSGHTKVGVDYGGVGSYRPSVRPRARAPRCGLPDEPGSYPVGEIGMGPSRDSMLHRLRGVEQTSRKHEV